MAVTWNEFIQPIEGITLDTRFFLPVELEIAINYVSTVQNIENLQRIANLISDTVLSVLRDQPGCELHALKLVANRQAIDAPITAEGQPSYFNLSFTNPVYDFMIQVGPETIRIWKARSTLRHLVDTIPILEKLFQRLFVATNITKPEHALLDVMDIRKKVHRIAFGFSHNLRIGTHIMEQHKQATNIEIIEKVIRFKLPPPPLGSNPERDSPLAALNPEPDGIKRGDISLCFTKKLGARPRSLWVTIEAPNNVTKEDVDVRVSYRAGEGDAPLEEEDLRDFKTPSIDFYRNLILARFIPALFYDIKVEARI